MNVKTSKSFCWHYVLNAKAPNLLKLLYAKHKIAPKLSKMSQTYKACFDHVRTESHPV